MPFTTPNISPSRTPTPVAVAINTPKIPAAIARPLPIQPSGSAEDLRYQPITPNEISVVLVPTQVQYPVQASASIFEFHEPLDANTIPQHPIQWHHLIGNCALNTCHAIPSAVYNVRDVSLGSGVSGAAGAIGAWTITDWFHCAQFSVGNSARSATVGTLIVAGGLSYLVLGAQVSRESNGCTRVVSPAEIQRMMGSDRDSCCAGTSHTFVTSPAGAVVGEVVLGLGSGAYAWAPPLAAMGAVSVFLVGAIVVGSGRWP